MTIPTRCSALLCLLLGCSDSNQTTSRIYLANTDSQSVTVIDDTTQEILTTIDIGNHPYGLAPSSEGDFIYVTTERGFGEVVAIDTSDNTIAWRVEAGSQLNEPNITRDNRFVYAPDLFSETTYVVDVQRPAVVAQITTPGSALHNTYASYDGDHMYVTAILSQRIFRIDTVTRLVSRV